MREDDTATHVEPVPTASALDMVIELRPRAGDVDPVFFGRVFDADGSPVQGATVRLGQENVVTDANGEYRLVLSYWDTSAPLLADTRDGRFAAQVAPTRPQRVNGSANSAGQEPLEWGPLDFHLPASMASLTGQVVDSSGRPVAGLEVRLLESTRRGSAIASLERPAGSTGKLGQAITDSRGVFRFRSMLDRPYHVRLIEPDSLYVHDETEVMPGSGIRRIVLPDDRYLDRLEGVVVDAFGAPVSGATVGLEAVTQRWSGTRSWASGRETTTDESGRFQIDRAPWRGLELGVSLPRGKIAGDTSFKLEDLDLGAPLRVEIDLACELVLRLDGESEVTAVEFQDGDGVRLEVVEIRSDLRNYGRRTRRRDDGTFPLTRVSQRATAAVLLAKDSEVRRVLVRPNPSERTVVDL